MKFRNFIKLFAFLAGPLFGQAPAAAAKDQAAPIVSVQATASASKSDVVERLKARVDPSYVKSLGTCSDHSQSPSSGKPVR